MAFITFFDVQDSGKMVLVTAAAKSSSRQSRAGSSRVAVLADSSENGSERAIADR